MSSSRTPFMLYGVDISYPLEEKPSGPSGIPYSSNNVNLYKDRIDEALTVAAKKRFKYFLIEKGVGELGNFKTEEECLKFIEANDLDLSRYHVIFGESLNIELVLKATK